MHVINPDKPPPVIAEFLAYNERVSRQYIAETPDRERYSRTHEFEVVARGCLDGRMSNFPMTLGLGLGVMTYRRSEGGRIPWHSDHLARDLTDGLRKASRGGKPVIQMLTVHYSGSFPGHGCKAYNHDTLQAVRDGFANAERLIRAAPGRIFPVVMKQNTDDEDVTLLTPDGRSLCVSHFVPRLEDSALSGFFADLLCSLFPPDKPPLSLLPRNSLRAAYYREWAEMLVSNLRFVNNVRREGRPIELLDHQERLMGIGNAFWWVCEHNYLFLVDDRVPAWKDNATMGLEFLMRTTLLDAAEKGDDDWVAPLPIARIYEHDEDRGVIIECVRGKCAEVMEMLPQAIGKVTAALTDPIKGIVSGRRADWVNRQLKDIGRHVAIFPAVLNQETIRLEPISL